MLNEKALRESDPSLEWKNKVIPVLRLSKNILPRGDVAVNPVTAECGVLTGGTAEPMS